MGKKQVATSAKAGTSTDMRVTLPANKMAVAKMQREAEGIAELFEGGPLTLASADEYTAADAALTEVVQRKDAAVAMRKRATGPMYTAIREVESWFAPMVRTLEGVERMLKNSIGAYRLAEAERARQLEAKAQEAAEAAEVETMLECLTEASDARQAPEGRATFAWHWVVKRINPMLVTREWLTPDLAKINAAADAAKQGEAPVIAGVTFEKAAKIGARR